MALLSLPACFVILGDGDCEHDAPPNWKLPTMGGNQFWTDVFHRSGWRIQRHFATGHFRLLDSRGFRQAWGTRQHCGDRLDGLADSIPANRSTVLILAHGLGRTSNCWGPMTRHVQAETDWQVVPFTYASTRESIDSHADALGQLIEGLGSEVETIHFIGHSLGNIVMRRHLAKSASNPDPRMGRFVMIGPPNQGSQMARLLYPTLVFPLIAGETGESLGRGWEELEDDLAIPAGEFGIIAGGHADDRQGWNPLLQGASDGTVSLSEALLPGAADLIVQPLLHSTMMRDGQVCRSSVRFLRRGRFAEDGMRCPVE